MPGTRVQILRDINSWIKNFEAPSIFWVTGMAGSGKTAINQTVCKQANEDPAIVLGGSFFCSRSAGLVTRRDVRCVIPTLAQILARQSATFSQALANELNRDPDVLHKEVAIQVKQLLHNPLLALQDSTIPILFVIDGLDECSGLSTAEEMLEDSESDRVVSEMLEALVAFSRLLPKLPVKFMLTSRPETHIRETSISSRTFSEVLLLHTISKKQVTADIYLYITDKISRSTQLRAWFTEADADLLAKLCDGLFIVATTALHYVLGAGTRRATAQFETLLNKSQDGLLPGAVAALESIYFLVLDSAASFDGLPVMMQLLAALLSARMTLSVAALADLLDMPIVNVRAVLSRLHAVVHVPEDDCEAGLCTLHASFGDYLIGQAPSHIRIASHFGHTILSEACLQVMLRRLHFNISQSRSSYEWNSKTRPEAITLSLEYACLHWIYHISGVPELAQPGGLAYDEVNRRGLLWTPRKSSQSIREGLDNKTNEVLRPRFLFWLEVMSMLGQTRRASAMLIFAAATVSRQILMPMWVVIHHYSPGASSAAFAFLSGCQLVRRFVSASDRIQYTAYLHLGTAIFRERLPGVQTLCAALHWSCQCRPVRS